MNPIVWVWKFVIFMIFFLKTIFCFILNLKLFVLCISEWCTSDMDESNRKSSFSEKSDTDTSHVEEIRDSDEDGDKENLSDGKEGCSDIHKGRKNKADHLLPNENRETVYVVNIEEEFSSVSPYLYDQA